MELTDNEDSSGDEIIPTTKRAKLLEDNPLKSISNISSKILPSVLLFYKKKYENFYLNHSKKKKRNNMPIDSIVLPSENIEPRPQTYKELPIYNYKKQIVDALKTSYFLIITAETGSGKTTQLPKFFLQHIKEYKFIACIQPRRVAGILAFKRGA